MNILGVAAKIIVPYVVETLVSKFYGPQAGFVAKKATRIAIAIIILM
ncbi:MAG: hypothetical protein AAGJ08_11020 [Cyanobacteria bacterium P01_H01_bin.35]